MGRLGIRGLETRVWRECSIRRGGADSTVEVYVSEESEERGVYNVTYIVTQVKKPHTFVLKIALEPWH